MANCGYGCEELPEYRYIGCGSVDRGGSFSYAIVECDNVITDPENTTLLEQAVAIGDLKLVRGVNWVFDDPDQVDAPNFGCGPENRLLGFNGTVTVEDPNVSGRNDDFYEKLNRRKFFLMLFNCETNKIMYVQEPCISRARPRKNIKGEVNMYMITFEWFSESDNFPQWFTADPDFWGEG